jgi:hypothetical protein
MKAWMIVAIAVAMLAVAGIVAANLALVGAADSTQQQITSCQSCQGRCTAENNCGLDSCRAAEGKACNCGQR